MLRLYTSKRAARSFPSRVERPLARRDNPSYTPAIVRLLCLLAISVSSLAACLPIEEAAKHVGETVCIRGRILKVAATPGGTHLLRFCEEGRECAFSAVVFPRDLRQVGDVRTLEGKEVEVHGHIRLYYGQPEVIVRDSRQLKGQAAKLPPIPKDYDVANRGKFSPGQRPTHLHRTPKAKRPRHGAETVPEIPPGPE